MVDTSNSFIAQYVGGQYLLYSSIVAIVNSLESRAIFTTNGRQTEIETSSC